MILQYEMTVEDIVEFSYFSSYIRTKGKRMLKYIVTGVSAIMILLISCLTSFSRLPNQDIFLLIFILSPASLWMIRSKWLTKFLIERSYRRGLGLNETGVITLNFLEENLISTMKIGESTFHWSAFKILRENKDYFFLFINTNKAIIIPKRIFLLPQEEYDVKSFIERKLAEQKNIS